MKNAGFALMLCSVLTPLSAYGECVTPPDCGELGFTADASKCRGSFLRCPWDLSKAACEETLPVLYGDGTVSMEIISGKTPIGIVFDETNRLALALTNIKEDGSAGSVTMHWANSIFCDIASMTDCDYSENDSRIDSCDIDGRANTTAILNCGSCCGGTPAATAANNYQPAGCSKDFCKKTEWFLPSMRDLSNIYNKLSIIDSSLASLSRFGGEGLGTNIYWSSVYKKPEYAWTLATKDGRKAWFFRDNNYVKVRPVIKY